MRHRQTKRDTVRHMSDAERHMSAIRPTLFAKIVLQFSEGYGSVKTRERERALSQHCQDTVARSMAHTVKTLWHTLSRHCGEIDGTHSIDGTHCSKTVASLSRDSRARL